MFKNDLQPGSFVYLLHKNFYRPPDDTGFNEIGIAIGPSNVLVQRRRKIINLGPIDLENVEKIGTRKWDEDESGEKIAAYFQRCGTNYRLFKTGMTALRVGNYKLFDAGHLFPSRRYYSNPEEKEAAWELLVSSLEVGDSIFTAEPSSLVSRVIANLDSGKWNHVATYIGEGLVAESVKQSGATVSQIADLQRTELEVGAYRYFEALTVEQQDALTRQVVALAASGIRYNLKGAIWCGVKTLLGNDPDPPTPNGNLYRGCHYPISNV